MRNQWYYKLLLVFVLPALATVSMAQVSAIDEGSNSTESNQGTGTGAGNDLAAPELTPPTPGSNASTINQAYISQASNTDVAYITQAGAGNYAAIYQAGRNASVAVIHQTGNNGYAVIRQN